MNKWNWSILFSWRSILYFHEGVFLGYASLGCLTGTHSQWTQYITPKGGPRSGFQVCSSSYDSPPNRHSETWRQGYLHIYISTYLRWTTAEKTPDRWWWWTRQGICDRWVKTNCYIICIDVLFMNAPCPRICTWNIRTTKTNICFFSFICCK